MLSFLNYVLNMVKDQYFRHTKSGLWSLWVILCVLLLVFDYVLYFKYHKSPYNFDQFGGDKLIISFLDFSMILNVQTKF